MISRIKASADSFVRQDAATRNYDGLPRLVISSGAGSTERRVFLYFGAIPRGGVLTSAILRFVTRGSWASGPHVVSARRVTGKWSEDRITWANAPAVDASSTPTVSVPTNTGGTTADIDVTALVAPIIAGADNFGFRLTVGTNGNKEIHSTENNLPDLRPILILTWSEAPEAPDDLRPRSGSIVSITKPVLSWAYRDPQGDAQARYNVQIATTSGGFGAPEFDSGWISGSQAEADLNVLGYTGLGAGATRFWRVRVEDVNGHQSDWSTVASMTRQAKGALTISAPANASTVTDLTPPITSTLATNAQRTIAYQLEEATGDAEKPWRTLLEFDPHPAAIGAGVAYTEELPAGLISRILTDYRLTVRSWDTYDRDGVAGDAPYVEAVTTFQWAKSAGVTAPTGTAAAAESSGAGIVLTFSRTTAPDSFRLLAGFAGGARRVVAEIDPGTAFVSGTSYRYVWLGARPRTLYDLEIEAEVNDVVSSGGPVAANAIVNPIGIWILNTVTGQEVMLTGKEAASLAIGESAETLLPLDGEPVRILDALRGLEGTIAGMVHSRADKVTLEEAVLASVERPGDVRLAFATENIPVILGEPSITPMPTVGGNDYSVSIAVWQVGEYDAELPA